MNNLDVNICNSNFCNVFNISILKFVTPESNQGFDIQNSEGLKLIVRVGLWLNIKNLDVICSCGQEIETSTLFLFHCFNFHCVRQTFLVKINSTSSNISSENEVSINKTLLFHY